MYSVLMTQAKNLNLKIDTQTLDDIDNFRFKNRFPSRTEAIRWLIEFALKQKPKRDISPE